MFLFCFWTNNVEWKFKNVKKLVIMYQKQSLNKHSARRQINILWVIVIKNNLVSYQTPPENLAIRVHA